MLRSAPRTEKVAIPAEYRTVEQRVMVSAPTVLKTVVPAKYATVKVKRLISAPEPKRKMIPAKYASVAKTLKVSEGRLEWRSVLCETNAGRGLITDIQRALKTRGYNPGPIDGVVGRETMAAVFQFQEKSDLSSGKLTLETIRALGVQSQ